MNKKIILIIIIIILIFALYSPVKEFLLNLITPEKILVVGDRVDEHGIEFNKTIEDKKIISKFENLFEDVNFHEESVDEKNISDFVTHIRHNKEGILTHWFEIWFNDDEAIVLRGMSGEQGVGKLNKEQVKILKEILE